jgi:NAD(P)-dependent dehydrogenase (short-subunit alcohol dehydrogenase family)
VKRIFITGGASGLGRALAERYQRAQWRVAIGDVQEERLAETARVLGRDTLAFRCDVRSVDDLQRVAHELREKWGGVDVVVNNAGIASGGRIDDIPLDEWQRVIDINLMGVVRGCHVFVPLLKEQRSGHIVNIASMAGLLNLPRMSSYNTAKAGVIALSETLRIELAEYGVHVTVVCPSFFRTNLAESLAASTTKEIADITHRLVTRNKIGAGIIAERVFRAVQRKELHVLTHRETRVAWAIKRWLPHGVFADLVRRIERKL